MNQSVISQVFAVLNKYDKSYTKDGVLKNLNTWEQNKSPLVELLRRHPNWNEDALAVVFDVTQSRELDHYDVNAYHRDLSALIEDLELSPDDANNLRCSLSIATGSYTKLLPDERVVSDIKYYSGVSCAMGQKASRVVHKICRKYGLDKHPEYNARFAKLADSLNPLQVKRRALLSVHPCDFLEMSNEDNSWNSCHCIREGEYHAGTLSYMNDGVSMIFYTVDQETDEDYHRKSKITRQVFCYGNGILLQSRLYPHTDDEEARDIYRDMVQRTISLCLDVPNLWKLKRKPEDVDRHCRTHPDALQYTDYIYSGYKPNVSLLESVYSDGGNTGITIGNTAFCLDCSCKLHNTDSLYCDSCDDGIEYINCECCGARIERESEDDYYVGNGHYCRDCVSWCDCCLEYTRDDMTYVYDRDGCQISVCEYCRDEYYEDCEDCGRYFHQDTGKELDDGFHCNDCLERRYFTCNRCGDYVRCEDAGEIDGKIYCQDCTEAAREELEEIEAECFATA